MLKKRILVILLVMLFFMGTAFVTVFAFSRQDVSHHVEARSDIQNEFQNLRLCGQDCYDDASDYCERNYVETTTKDSHGNDYCDGNYAEHVEPKRNHHSICHSEDENCRRY